MVGCALLLIPERSFPPSVAPALLGTWALAVVVAVVAWNSYFTTFKHEVAATRGCAKPSARLLERDNWSITTLSLVVQGPRPPRVILGAGSCPEWDAGERVLYGESVTIAESDGRFELPAPKP